MIRNEVLMAAMACVNAVAERMEVSVEKRQAENDWCDAFVAGKIEKILWEGVEEAGYMRTWLGYCQRSNNDIPQAETPKSPNTL